MINIIIINLYDILVPQIELINKINEIVKINLDEKSYVNNIIVNGSLQ